MLVFYSAGFLNIVIMSARNNLIKVHRKWVIVEFIILYPKRDLFVCEG